MNITEGEILTLVRSKIFLYLFNFAAWCATSEVCHPRCVLKD